MPNPPPNRVDLSRFDPDDYNPGRPFLIRSLWFLVNALFLQNPLNPSSQIKVRLLRLFGAKIGRGAVLKPSINVKSPWFLTVGDNCWIGERAWLDNLVPITLGDNVCISQGVYLCTGNHDWSDPAFGYKLGEILVEDGAWVCAGALVLPGVVVADHSIVAGGAVLTKNTAPYGVYAGNPAVEVRKRVVKSATPPAQ